MKKKWSKEDVEFAKKAMNIATEIIKENIDERHHIETYNHIERKLFLCILK